MCANGWIFIRYIKSSSKVCFIQNLGVCQVIRLRIQKSSLRSFKIVQNFQLQFRWLSLSFLCDTDKMRAVVVLFLTLYLLYHHASANQQSNQDDPTKPFWASRGRRSGRLSIKADDDILPEKWSEDYGMPEVLEKEIRTKQQATSFLANLLNSIYSWNGDGVKKRGDPKTSDPSNPFWAARG